MPRLTEIAVAKACKIDGEAQSKFWDDQIPGFGLFVGKKAKTFYYQREVAGKTTRVRIGPWPTISARAARETAQDLQLQHTRGRGKAAMRRVPTLQEATEAYVARPKLRSDEHKKNVQAMTARHLGDWLSKPLDEMTGRWSRPATRSSGRRRRRATA